MSDASGPSTSAGGWISEFRAGAFAIAPILLGVAPFALVTGAVSVADGATVLQAAGFSVLACLRGHSRSSLR